MIPLHLFCADSASGLGKADLSMLPHQTLMEIFFSHFGRTKCHYFDSDGHLRDIHTFKRAIEVNEENEVIRVDILNKKIGGTLHMQYLPQTTYFVDVSENMLEGTITFLDFPAASVCVLLEANKLKGPLSFQNHPKNLKFLNLRMNELSGSVDLTFLGDSFRYLDLSYNEFEGSLDLSRISQPIKFTHSLTTPYEIKRSPLGYTAEHLAMSCQENAFSGNVILRKYQEAEGLKKIFKGTEVVEFVDLEGSSLGRRVKGCQE